jgi:hypothetical protein
MFATVPTGVKVNSTTKAGLLLIRLLKKNNFTKFKILNSRFHFDQPHWNLVPQVGIEIY